MKAAYIIAKDSTKNAETHNSKVTKYHMDSTEQKAIKSNSTAAVNMTPKYLTLDKVRTMLGIENTYSGKNVTIAVVDSGVYSHADLVKPTNRIVAFKDFINNSSTAYDDNGHGTAISGIIAGNGYLSNGLYKGIAPLSNIVAIKVTDRDGKANVENIIKAINWIIENKEKYNIKIVNISIGIVYNQELTKQIKESIDKAIHSNILVVTSVGNSEQNKVFLPAALPNVLTVGSINEMEKKNPQEYTPAYFSSSWKSNEGFSKPDLLAPGNNILSLQSDVLFNPTEPNDMTMNVSYVPVSGTSESAAVISGVAAVLMEKYPDKSSDSIKQIILNNCININADSVVQGKGFFTLQP